MGTLTRRNVPTQAPVQKATRGGAANLSSAELFAATVDDSRATGYLGLSFKTTASAGEIFGHNPRIAINLRQSHRFFLHLFLGHEQRINRTRFTQGAFYQRKGLRAIVCHDTADIDIPLPIERRRNK